MEDHFEMLIESYLKQNVGIAENFISAALAGHLKDNLLELNNNAMLLAAGTGNANKQNQNKLVRSDAIYWLDKKHNNVYENAFFAYIEAFILYLNRSCYAGITGYEFHYTLYEPGSFYVKHFDRFKDDDSRAFSMISYLNADWKESDGGELLIHQLENNLKIAPTNGKTVFFKSDELEHEVLVTHEKRMSITGWLKRG
ncbi:proline hydroxylase [Flavobacterium noncentrifugens]|uniref:SM-20-related protein n=1 Tax=Flavobacterium noncentrifugens TaxID=1128970 RepID=A0A1G8T9D3_9FLAO|nr:2OG-Fe(II) oxygenase [Flavobacterium noncentrifugens]GEP50139.1 proline hydroxylase [Flavobacterium noncentrifugens]SDJ38192.1 SM-20-related protein [Flavobacterium noncentrifugens]